MKYKVGDKVRIKSLDWYNNNKSEEGIVELSMDNFVSKMSQFCGKVMTITDTKSQFYHMLEDSGIYFWTDEMIEGLAENKLKMNACEKCVFAVYDDNPHCGLRGFRTSFNVERCSAENDTVPNGYELQKDGYFSWVEKEKEYPKTYEECCVTLEYIPHTDDVVGYKWDILQSLQKLLICRDAYWKIAGEEMGLGKHWEPDWNNFLNKYCIINCEGQILRGVRSLANAILASPTEEMRDAFYENFNSEIESCKEVL